ncbi:MAG: DUF368 domain-containing protein [Mycoplasmataceae bacterium]|nr:DUF368 domain-containing protein [Mycoplasmataceae bacterium]
MLKKVKRFFSILFAGMFMSASDTIPGFSGGIGLTIIGKLKEVWGKFDEIKNPKKKGDRKHAIWFYIIFAIGSTAGVFGFSQIVKLLLEYIPSITFWFFITLTIGSLFIYISYNKITIKRKTSKKVTKRKIFGIMFGFGFIIAIILITFLMRGYQDVESMRSQKGEVSGVKTITIIYMAGFLASAAMVTPGVSGALIILMFGVYGHIYGGMYAHPWDHPVVLTIYILSTVVGTVFSTIVLGKIYDKFKIFMNWFFLGTILASIIGMFWVFNPMLVPDEPIKWIYIVCSIIIGSVLTFLLWIRSRRISK